MNSDLFTELCESARQLRTIATRSAAPSRVFVVDTSGTRLLLSADDAALFAEALAASPEPAPALERAFARKRALLQSSGT
jgi:hypothetical protein